MSLSRTDRNGHADLLFIGRRNAEGRIIGERYVRTLIFDVEGKRIKDHWDRKGRAG